MVGLVLWVWMDWSMVAVWDWAYVKEARAMAGSVVVGERDWRSWDASEVVLVVVVDCKVSVSVVGGVGVGGVLVLGGGGGGGLVIDVMVENSCGIIPTAES